MGLGTFADWIQLGAFGVVSIAFLWGLMKGFPRILDKYTEALTIFARSLTEERASREMMQDKHVESLKGIQQEHSSLVREMSDECHRVHRESHIILERTREALIRTETALERSESLEG